MYVHVFLYTYVYMSVHVYVYISLRFPFHMPHFIILCALCMCAYFVCMCTYDFYVIIPVERTGGMRCLRLVGSIKMWVSFAEYRLFYRALLQTRPIILRSLLIVATQ